ncbi:hypothetical protein N7532_002150 [Penicillium argentinense]|uniref:Maltose/galactoside acetyltransferase domain-containing protein n=1 Tax=Penicillium argentinense TaxID=1131581 RepID=A0A9W9KMG2_9EURO|nr:uncharacterized protein N7532_002150 [Penicillium argentinense]KAJ5111615.1 hypothetical protein N7532_002150 [Penicillium argentinense]
MPEIPIYHGLSYLSEMIPLAAKSEERLEQARHLQGVCWGEEYERMVSGMLYSPLAPELVAGRSRARRLMADFNAPLEMSLPTTQVTWARDGIVQRLFGAVGRDVCIEPPLLTVLDCGLVTIGNHVAIGPNVNIITGEHETSIEARRDHRGSEFTREVTIGDDCWIGAGVTILAGAHIGEGSSIGAGSVVKGEILPFSVAVGVPARVVKSMQSSSVSAT